MQRSNYVAAAVLLLSASSVMAQAVPPTETPQVTVGADTKLLIFDWDPVPGATYYQLFVNPDGASGYSPTGGQIAAPGNRAGFSVAAHLQHWQTAKYKVSACNAAGCRDSKALFPRRHMLETIGYIKASNTGPDFFGQEVALSLDGNTLAVAAPGEASNAKGVNGNQADNSFTHNSGAVYVYRKVSGQWRQQAYLKAPDNVDGRRFGGSSLDQRALGLSSDGSTLAVGAPGRGAGEAAGEVVIFTRASSGAWSVATTLHSPDTQPRDAFGLSVDLSADGNTLKAVSYAPGTADTLNPQGRTYLFVRAATGWQHQQTIAMSGDPCLWSRMSADGNTLVHFCFVLRGDGSGDATVLTHKRSGSTWSLVNSFGPGLAGSRQRFALSYDGRALGLTSGADPTQAAVLLYRWNGVSGWNQEQIIKAPVRDPEGFSDFGVAVEFNQSATLLAVGDDTVAPQTPPAGISESAPTQPWSYEGAVYLYQRQAGPPSWAFRAVVKAPNPDYRDGFGRSVTLSATGNSLAVGAYSEASTAKGINGNQMDDSLPDAGAVYLY